MLKFEQSKNGKGDPVGFYRASGHIGGEQRHTVAFVSMNPAHLEVADPGMWSASIYTIDDGLFSLGLFDSRIVATSVAQWGWVNNRHFDGWVEFYNRNGLNGLKGSELHAKLLGLMGA